MTTKASTVMILKEPLNKWDSKNRATDIDPSIATCNFTLMTTKLRSILKSHGEKVAISNSLVLEILEAYIKKSKRVKKLEAENAELRKKLSQS